MPFIFNTVMYMTVIVAFIKKVARNFNLINALLVETTVRLYLVNHLEKIDTLGLEMDSARRIIMIVSKLGLSIATFFQLGIYPALIAESIFLFIEWTFALMGDNYSFAKQNKFTRFVEHWESMLSVVNLLIITLASYIYHIPMDATDLVFFVAVLGLIILEAYRSELNNGANKSDLKGLLALAFIVLPGFGVAMYYFGIDKDAMWLYLAIISIPGVIRHLSSENSSK